MDANGIGQIYYLPRSPRPSATTRWPYRTRQAYLYDQGTNGIGRLSEIHEFDPQSVLVGRIIYGYDPKGRILTHTQAYDGLSFRTVTYQYDGFGRLATIAYPYPEPEDDLSVS